ncbi:S-adenosyl-L-methionine-dependent methyltransferase [Chytridium lagenaria]|nr:S-adenosyl-L-methionine-dependent methyltransferase [Chytridium lagenaria]
MAKVDGGASLDTTKAAFNENALKSSAPVKTRPICYGRVESLEEMVPQQWWKSVFGDAMYLKTDGDVVEDPEVTQAEIAMLEQDADIRIILQKGNGQQNGLTSGAPAKILDLCCGQGRHSLFLAKEYPYLSVFGHDQSSYLISLAQERASFSNLASNVTFTVGDCRQVPYPDQFFDLVILMGNSFGYFTDDNEDRVVLNEVFRVLVPGGKVILDLTDGEHMRNNFSSRGWEWMDDKTFVCRERQLSKDGVRISSREVITSTTQGVIRDQFYQERLYTREEIENMLKEIQFETGLEKLSLPSVAVTTAKDLSKRQEDLGMMEHRMLVKAGRPSPDAKAQVDRKVPGLVAEEACFMTKPFGANTDKLFEKLVVIMGDPLQPCVDNHVRLIDALQANSQKSFVFNLCDEGFNNDATKELHVPSVLEMIDIPYSGLVNRAADCLGIPTPRELTFLLDVATPAIESVEKLHNLIEAEVGYPAFIKPMKGDNSLGITGRSIVRSETDVDSYIGELAELGIREVVIQEYLEGTEYSIGMIGNISSGFHFLPILEVDYSKIVARELPPILGYESKWDPKSPYWTDIGFKKANCKTRLFKSYIKVAFPCGNALDVVITPGLTSGVTEEPAILGKG